MCHCSCVYILFGIIGSFHLGLSCSVNMIYFIFFSSHFVFYRQWTLTTTQMLKHLKIYFVLSFIVLHVTPLSPTISDGVRTLCVCVFVCGVFVSLLYESCKMANIHLLYKVSFFSPTITFGFLFFFLHVFPHQWC